MVMITLAASGTTENIESFLKAMGKRSIAREVEKYARIGRDALAAATPVLTGHAATSWSYQIVTKKDRLSIYWTNSDVEDGFPVVIGLQYGYATGTGGYVYGRDFINPAIRPVFDMILEQVWRVVTNG